MESCVENHHHHHHPFYILLSLHGDKECLHSKHDINIWLQSIKQRPPYLHFYSTSQ